MHTANDCFAAGHFEAALEIYNDALRSIDALLAGDELCVPVLMAKIVSHHNRAATFVRLQRFSDADEEYHAAHAFVRTIVEDSSLPAQLRATAQGHCAITFVEWQAFRREQGLHSGAPVPGPARTRSWGPRVVH